MLTEQIKDDLQKANGTWKNRQFLSLDYLAEQWNHVSITSHV